MKKRKKKKEMKEKEKFLTASITVEASYIVPMILSIIFAIMVASFYFHDVVIARAVLEKNIEKLENAFIHPLEKDDYYYDYKAINERFLYSFSGDYKVQESMGIRQIEKELNASLILLHPENIKVKMKKKKLIASVELFCGIALPGTQYLRFFGKIRKVTITISVYNQADFIRILTIIDNKT